MSLILTQSNSALGSNPASYVNRFKNTFEIKANAEIVVQEVGLSVLIERSELVRILVRRVCFETSYPFQPQSVKLEKEEKEIYSQANLFRRYDQVGGGGGGG